MNMSDNKKKHIGIGLIGMGTVGQGVLKIFQDNFLNLHDEVKLIKVCARRLEGKRQTLDALGFNTVEITTNYHQVIDDERIDIVVELIGGVKDAKIISETALKNKKHMVLANKALLSEEIDYLSKLARKNDCHLLYEAAVAGSIPILKILSEKFTFTKIGAIYSIINGTSNYILSQMTRAGLSFHDALIKAQELGLPKAIPPSMSMVPTLLKSS